MNQKIFALAVVVFLIPLAAGKVNNFQNSDDWQIQGDGEFTPRGLVLYDNSLAFSEYEDVAPTSLRTQIEPGKTGRYRVSFKNDFRPIIRITARPDKVSVNGEEIGSEPPFTVILNLDWQNNTIRKTVVNQAGDAGKIPFLRDSESIDRTRIFQGSGATRGLYRSITTRKDEREVKPDETPVDRRDEIRDGEQRSEEKLGTTGKSHETTTETPRMVNWLKSVIPFL